MSAAIQLSERLTQRMNRQASLKYLNYSLFRVPGNTKVSAMRNIRVALFLCAWYSVSYAQVQTPEPEAASSTSQLAQPELTAEDTLPVFFSLSFAPEKKLATSDTMPDQEFRLYDPARKASIDYGHLGNLGSSARSLWFTPLSRAGFETGYRAFNLYELTPEKLQFYRHARTYSHAYFSRGRSQRDAESWIKLSRTFSGGLNFSVQYKTINNLGNYRFQRTKHNSLAAGLWWPVKKNYEVFLIYASNTFQQQDNGGVTDPMFFDSTLYEGMISVPVLLDGDNSKTKNTKRDLQFAQYYTFGKTANRLFRAEHTLDYKTEIWKFSDINSASDSQPIEAAFYGAFLTDSRGLRNYVKTNRLDNVFLLNTLPAKSDSLVKDNRFSAGIRHSLIWLEQEPLNDSLFNNLFLTGRFTFEPSKRLSLIAQGDLGLLPKNGYRVTGDLKIDLGKVGILEAGLLNQLHPPDYIQSRAYSTGRLVYNNDFKQVLESTLKGSYSIPKLGFRASGALHVVNNYIYFGTTGLPVQAGGVVQVSQLMVQQNFKLGILRSENTIGVQQINNKDIVRLPNWFSKNSLYIARSYFKRRLYATYGFDFRINSDFLPDEYQPFTGQFQLQRTAFSQAPYPWLDVFTAVKIDQFRLFLRFENVMAAFDPGKALFLAANQPQSQFSFRLGIAWRFLDSNTGNASSPGSGTQPGTFSPGGTGGRIFN